MALVAQQASFPQISSIDPVGTGLIGDYDDGSASALGGSSSIGAGDQPSEQTRSFSRLPALKKRRPKMKVVFQLELKELRGEVRDLQAKLNALVGESKQKQSRLKAMIDGDRSETRSAPPPQIGTPAYMQQQLWLVEQASAAEKKYEVSLKTLLDQAVSDERAQEREKLLIERELQTTMRELRLARDRGSKIGRLKDHSRAQLNHLQEQSMLSERERNAQLGELGAVRSTVLEQQLRMQERRKRREMFVAEAAGDMDEEGEAALQEKLQQIKIQQSISRQEALQAASRARALQEEWARITEVSGEEEEVAIIRRYESQRDSVSQLQIKQGVVEEKLKQLNADLVAHIDERHRLWQERGSGQTGNMMEMVSMYQEQIQKAEADAARRSKKALKVEQILYESKDKIWSICARLAGVPAIAQVAGRGITQSQTESNLVNIRTLLPELDRYLPVLMRVFASVVPEDARYNGLEISPPWSSPVQRPIISIVDSYMKPLKAASDDTRQISVRALSPDDLMMATVDTEVDNSAGIVAGHGDVQQLRRHAGIEVGALGKKGGKGSRKDSKEQGRGGGRTGRRGRGRGGSVSSRRPKNLSPING